MQSIEMAFSEVCEIFSYLDKELIEKIPLSVRKFIEDERDIEHKITLNPKLPLQEQNLLIETYNILGVLKLKYWCKSDSEKNKLISIINKNEFEEEKIKRKKYNPDDIFKRKQKTIDRQVENQVQMIEYKETFFKKILNKIKSFFNINNYKYNK